MRAYISLITSALILSAVPAFPQIYTWTDASGTTNFTDNPETIPAKYRKKAVLVGSDDATSQESPSPGNMKAGTYNIISRPVEEPKNAQTRPSPDPTIMMPTPDSKKRLPKTRQAVTRKPGHHWISWQIR